MRKPKKTLTTPDDQTGQDQIQHEETMSELNGSAALHNDVVDDVDVAAAAPEVDTKKDLVIKVSGTLIRKLTMQAEDEGVSLSDFIGELLAEGAVLRAWEIVERKAQMRGGNVSGNQQQGNNRNPNQGGGRHNNNRNSNQGGGQNNRSNRNHQRYHTLMEDKAAFLEYVRNQERKQR